MKFSYNLSTADLNTIIFALGILPELELEDSPAQANLNQLCSISAVHKLSSGNTKFSANEFRVISAAIQALYLIIHGELDVDPETKTECSRYVFDINRLMSVFDIDFDTRCQRQLENVIFRRNGMSFFGGQHAVSMQP